MLDHLLTSTERLAIGTALLAYVAFWMWALWREMRKEYQRQISREREV